MPPWKMRRQSRLDPRIPEHISSLISIVKLTFTDWHQFVTERSWDWLDQIMVTFEKATELHVVFYENLKQNLSEELMDMAKFLGVNVSDNRLNCSVHHSRGVAKRANRKVPDEVFRPLERDVLTLIMTHAYNAFRRHRIPRIPRFYEEAAVRAVTLEILPYPTLTCESKEWNCEAKAIQSVINSLNRTLLWMLVVGSANFNVAKTFALLKIKQQQPLLNTFVFF